jgi:hypothetical protein
VWQTIWGRLLIGYAGDYRLNLGLCINYSDVEESGVGYLVES